MIASMENQRLIMLSGEFDAKAGENGGKERKGIKTKFTCICYISLTKVRSAQGQGIQLEKDSVVALKS